MFWGFSKASIAVAAAGYAMIGIGGLTGLMRVNFLTLALTSCGIAMARMGQVKYAGIICAGIILFLSQLLDLTKGVESIIGSLALIFMPLFVSEIASDVFPMNDAARLRSKHINKEIGIRLSGVFAVALALSSQLQWPTFFDFRTLVGLVAAGLVCLLPQPLPEGFPLFSVLLMGLIATRKDHVQG